MNKHQQKIIAGLPQIKQDFITKQLAIYKGQGFMDGSMFMPCDGRCYHCKRDIITEELSKGNDGSKSVTGCPFCHRSYCD